MTIAFAVPFEQPDDIVNLVLKRTWMESSLPLRDRGLRVHHDLFPAFRPETATRIIVDGNRVQIESTVRPYLLDLSAVQPGALSAMCAMLERMHWGRPFELVLR